MVYEELLRRDLIGPIQTELDKGNIWIDVGTKKITLKTYVRYNYPWVMTGVAEGRECSKWLDVWFGYYKLVSKGCHECYKVVVKPKSLKELFMVLEIQEKLGLHSKCGIELRTWVKGMFGAFWYCPRAGGIEGAKETHRKVRNAVWDKLGVITDVLLKKGCTEMEAYKGPSDQWVYTEEEEKFEAYLEENFDFGVINIIQPDLVKVHVTRAWIEYVKDWDRRTGADPSWKLYADPRSFKELAPSVRYDEGGGKNATRILGLSKNN